MRKEKDQLTSLVCDKMSAIVFFADSIIDVFLLNATSIQSKKFIIVIDMAKRKCHKIRRRTF